MIPNAPFSNFTNVCGIVDTFQSNDPAIRSEMISALKLVLQPNSRVRISEELLQKVNIVRDFILKAQQNDNPLLRAYYVQGLGMRVVNRIIDLERQQVLYRERNLNRNEGESNHFPITNVFDTRRENLLNYVVNQDNGQLDRLMSYGSSNRSRNDRQALIDALADEGLLQALVQSVMERAQGQILDTDTIIKVLNTVPKKFLKNASELDACLGAIVNENISESLIQTLKEWEEEFTKEVEKNELTKLQVKVLGLQFPYLRNVLANGFLKNQARARAT